MSETAGPVCPVLDFPVLAVSAASHGLPPARRPPIVVMLQNNLQAMLASLPLPWSLLRTSIVNAYAKSAGAIFLSKGVRDGFFKLLPAYAGKSQVIPNAAWSNEIERLSWEQCPLAKPRGRKLLVACGRLSRQKGFDVLLRAASRVARHLAIELWILGEGRGLPDLNALAGELGLAEQVRFLGFRDNPFPFFRQADLFVLASRWEGFGNVIVEALGCGTPVVATDCPFGPAEILGHGRWGRLVPVEDSEALAAAIREVLESEALRDRFASTGPLRAREFEADAVASAYASFLRNFQRMEF
jgi:glycosyltransferase involved in cell wall biosynthesis